MKRRGLTLIECILATFIVAVGFVAVASVYPLAFRGATLDANHVAAMQLASSTLSQIRALPYGATPAPGGTLSPVTRQTSNEDSTTQVTFNRTVTFERGGAAASAQTAGDVARVTVTWIEGTGASGEATQKSVSVTGGVSRVP